MRRDSRLSLTLHALVHMAEADRAFTSEELANRMDTHPVVMRRTMSGLREAGIVHSEKGHGGGWTLARATDRVTLADIYEALGITTLFAIGPRTDSPGCLVEQAVNQAMERALTDAQALLFERLRAVKLSDLHAAVSGRLPKTHGSRGKRPRSGRNQHA